MKNINKSLLSGSMETMLLKLLSEKDMYGYEMIEALRARSENVFELKAGTLYPILHALETKNYLESYEQEGVGKVRKYYSITKDGKKYAIHRCKTNPFTTMTSNFTGEFNEATILAIMDA